jgi:hypothetical protein
MYVVHVTHVKRARRGFMYVVSGETPPPSFNGDIREHLLHQSDIDTIFSGTRHWPVLSMPVQHFSHCSPT